MAINFTDFSRLPLQDSPFKDLFENVLKGYKMGQEPAKMADEAQQRKLANSLNELALQHKPKEYSLSDSLKEAQIKKANQPAQIGGALANALRLKASLPKGSEDYNAVSQYINKLSTPSQGVQISNTPDGGLQVSLGGQGESASIPGLPKLKSGETYLYNQEKQPIGIGKPMSEGEKKEFGGRAFFNNLQPFLNEAQAPYTGKGSNKRFESDVLNYSKDKAARERVNNLLAADKLLFSGVVKENATIGGANTNKVYDRLTKSLQSAEIFPFLRDKAPYILEEGYGKEVGQLMNQKLNEATEASSNQPAYKPFYFNRQESHGKVTAPAQPANIKNKQEFQSWLRTLTPAQVAAVKAKHLGGK